MSDCNSCDLPMTANTRIGKSSCPVLESDSFNDLSKIRSLYMSLVGKLNYLSVVSRPELSFVVPSLSQVLKNPFHDHWLLAKKVLRYLKGTFDLGFVFGHSECLKLVSVTLIGEGNPMIGVPRVAMILKNRMIVVSFVGLPVNSKQ